MNFGNFAEIENSNKVVFIHVGRAVSFKAPEESLNFALHVAMMGYQVELYYVGIDYLSEIEMLEIPDNLQVIFHGLISNALKINSQACFMLNFAKFQESGEVIGMAALESLALGVPVIIESKTFTTFRNLPGVIERNQFLKLLESHSRINIDHETFCKIPHRELKIIHEELATNNLVLEILSQKDGKGVFCSLQDKPD